MPEPEGIDEATFRQEALDRFQTGVEETVESRLDAVSMARILCDGDVKAMLDRLGADLAGNFQALAMNRILSRETSLTWDYSHAIPSPSRSR